MNAKLTTSVQYIPETIPTAVVALHLNSRQGWAVTIKTYIDTFSIFYIFYICAKKVKLFAKKGS